MTSIPLIGKTSECKKFQIHLSVKKKYFSQFISPFFEFALNFEHFQKKDNRHSLCITEIIDHERRP